MKIKQGKAVSPKQADRYIDRKGGMLADDWYMLINAGILTGYDTEIAHVSLRVLLERAEVSAEVDLKTEVATLWAKVKQKYLARGWYINDEAMTDWLSLPDPKPTDINERHNFIGFCNRPGQI